MVRLSGAAGLALIVMGSTAASADGPFQLSNNQRISCSRALTPGKQQTISCKSYAYVMNTATSDFYRCQVSVSILRDNKDVLKAESEGGCETKGRLFPEDANYAFDATETEPPNTNAFFGNGGTAIWVNDTTKLRVRGCIQLAVGVAPDMLKCVDMTFPK